MTCSDLGSARILELTSEESEVLRGELIFLTWKDNLCFQNPHVHALVTAPCYLLFNTHLNRAEDLGEMELQHGLKSSSFSAGAQCTAQLGFLLLTCFPFHFHRHPYPATSNLKRQGLQALYSSITLYSYSRTATH